MQAAPSWVLQEKEGLGRRRRGQAGGKKLYDIRKSLKGDKAPRGLRFIHLQDFLQGKYAKLACPSHINHTYV